MTIRSVWTYLQFSNLINIMENFVFLIFLTLLPSSLSTCPTEILVTTNDASNARKFHLKDQFTNAYLVGMQIANTYSKRFSKNSAK
jgi:hypothetical protein